MQFAPSPQHDPFGIGAIVSEVIATHSSYRGELGIRFPDIFSSTGQEFSLSCMLDEYAGNERLPEPDDVETHIMSDIGLRLMNDYAYHGRIVVVFKDLLDERNRPFVSSISIHESAQVYAERGSDYFAQYGYA